MFWISAAYAVMRCMFVRLSGTFVYSVQRNKHIFKIFSPSGSHTILVYSYQTSWRYSDGNAPNGGVECRWGRQKSRFSANGILAIGSMTAGLASNNCDGRPCSLSHRWRRISESCLSQPAAWTRTTKRTEQTLRVIVRSWSRSIGRRPNQYRLIEDFAQHIVLLKLTTDRHETSRGL